MPPIHNKICTSLSDPPSFRCSYCPYPYFYAVSLFSYCIPIFILYPYLLSVGCILYWWSCQRPITDGDDSYYWWWRRGGGRESVKNETERKMSSAFWGVGGQRLKHVHCTLQIMIFLTPFVTYTQKAPNSVTTLVAQETSPYNTVGAW